MQPPNQTDPAEDLEDVVGHVDLPPAEPRGARALIVMVVVVIERLDCTNDMGGDADGGEGTEDKGTIDARKSGSEIEEKNGCLAVGVTRMLDCFGFDFQYIGLMDSAPDC